MVADGSNKVIDPVTDHDARVVQHECDHLNGISIVSKVSKFKLKLAMKRRHRINEKKVMLADV